MTRLTRAAAIPRSSLKPTHLTHRLAQLQQPLGDLVGRRRRWRRGILLGSHFGADDLTRGIKGRHQGMVG